MSMELLKLWTSRSENPNASTRPDVSGFGPFLPGFTEAMVHSQVRLSSASQLRDNSRRSVRMAEGVEIWPGIQERLEKEWQDGYFPVAIRLNINTEKRLRSELAFLKNGSNNFGMVNSIVYIETRYGRVVLKQDRNMPDDTAILQVDAIPSRTYAGPVNLEVVRPGG